MVARVGISGWNYPPWRGDFYPRGLAHRLELGYAAQRLDSIEVNGTFYSLQRPTSFARWAAETPDGFLFSIKGPRFITHLKKLRDVDTALANFFASGVLALQHKLGPVLWQLPPSLGWDAGRIDGFLARLPRSTGEAAYLARKHDERMAGRSFTGCLVDRPLRHAMEVRHDSFKTPEFVALLREHSVALVTADTAGRWPQFFEVTADFCYLRLHGAGELYVSGYSDQELSRWADRVTGWCAQGLDVYCYFDNDVKVRAPFDAMALRSLLKAGRVTGAGSGGATPVRPPLGQPVS